MSRVRTFVAIPASTDIRKAGVDLIKAFAAVTDGVRWVLPENIHLTMKFLGDVEDRELHQICRIVNSVAAQASPFTLTCRSVGAFPNNARPNTLWLGVADPEGQLTELQTVAELKLADMGFPVERRPFQGHFTLGRIRSGKQENSGLIDLIEKYAEREFGLLPVKQLVVYSSELTRQGPTYTTLAHCPFGRS